MKKCPYCAEEIQEEAIKCKHCGEFINRELGQAPNTVEKERVANNPTIDKVTKVTLPSSTEKTNPTENDKRATSGASTAQPVNAVYFNKKLILIGLIAIVAMVILYNLPNGSMGSSLGLKKGMTMDEAFKIIGTPSNYTTLPRYSDEPQIGDRWIGIFDKVKVTFVFKIIKRFPNGDSAVGFVVASWKNRKDSEELVAGKEQVGQTIIEASDPSDMSEILSATGYRRPRFADRWEYFDKKTSGAEIFGIVIAKAEIGEISNELTGHPSAIEVCFIKDRAEDATWKPIYAGEVTTFQTGGDAMITGNPQVGDMVAFYDKVYGNGNSVRSPGFGWILYLEATDRKKSYDLIRAIFLKQEYDKYVDKLKQTAKHMAGEWSVGAAPNYSLIEGAFSKKKQMLPKDQIKKLINAKKFEQKTGP